MSGESESGPKFPGELADHLPRQEEPPDRWFDRFRHAWMVYLIVGIALVTWIALMISPVVYLGAEGWLIAFVVWGFPFGIYFRIIRWRLMTGRDPDTGEKMVKHDR